MMRRVRISHGAESVRHCTIAFSTTTTMAVTTDLAIDQTAEIGEYIRAVFQARIRNQPTPIQSPKKWSLHFLIEVNHVVQVLLQAFTNKSKQPVSYEILRY